MADFRAIDRDHVLTAIEQFDAVGGSAFLAAHGLREARSFVLVHRGRDYDSQAIVGLAHGLATGATLSPAEMRGGEVAAATALRDLGFEVRGDLPVPAPARSASQPRRPRATQAPGTRATASTRAGSRPSPARRPEPVVRVCPTCFMALPATGVCDTCD